MLTTGEFHIRRGRVQLRGEIMNHVNRGRGASLAASLACSFLGTAVLADCVDYREFPAVVGSIEQSALELQYYGDEYLLAATESGLAILVLDESALPSLLATVPLGEFGVQDLAVCGTVVYCQGYAELYAVDLSDVAAPVLLGEIELTGTPAGIGGAGDLLGIVEIDGTWSLYDMSDPIEPQLLHSQASEIIAADVAIAGQRAILTGNGWALHDITIPSAPALIAREAFDYTNEQYYGAGTTVRGCVPRGDTLVQYLDLWTRYGDWIHGPHFTHALTLRTVDLADPDNPLVTNEVALGTSQAWPNAVQAVMAVADDLAFVNVGGLRVFDLSSGLTQVASIPTNAVGDALVARDGHVHGGYVQITTFTYSQPPVDNRVFIGPSGTDEGGTTSHAVAGDGWFATTNWWEYSPSDMETIYGGTLRIFATASAQTVPVAEYGGEWFSYSDLAADGAILYYIENQQLERIDLSNPSDPGEPAAIPLEYYVQAVEKGPDGLVAVAGASGGLRIYDLTQPDAPELVSDVAAEYCQDLLWQGNLLMIGTPNGITCLDVQDPAAPVTLSTLAIGATSILSALDDTQLLASSEAAIRLIEFVNPTDPEVLAVNAGVGPIHGFVVIDETVYVGNGGVHVLELPTLADIGVLATDPTVGPLLWTAERFLGCRLHGAGAGEVPVHCGNTGVEDPAEDDDLPPPLAVVPLSAAPNPFNPRTTVRFTTPQAGPVSLDAHDLRGRLVRHLVDDVLAAGSHEIAWDGRDDAGRPLPSGTYLLRLSTALELRSVKVVLLE
jgi:hypothetical protein